jgi:NDP-sugar pyrophosphorylase family protein
VLKPTDTLRTAMRRVQKDGFTAVSDGGVFFDIDGRRAMLRGVSLDEPIGSLKLRRNAEALHRPPMDAVVMAGGKGTRLRSVTNGLPKPLLTLGKSTILERILSNLDADTTYLSVNYKAAMFKKLIGDRVTYLEEKTPLGNAGALSLLPKKGAPYVFITNADLITDVNYASMLDFHRSHNGPITMAAASFTTHLKYGVVHANKKGVLDGFDEKPDLTFLCNAGMYIVDRPTLKLVPKNKFFQMPDLIDAVQRRGEPVHVFPLWEKWVDAGSPEEFQQVLMEFARGEQQ